MAGLSGEITDIMGVIQRNKALRENRRQFNIEAELKARQLANEERRTDALNTQAEAQAAYARTGAEKQQREFSQEDANQAHYTIKDQGILTDTNRVDTGSVWTGLESGSAGVTQATIDLLNYGNDRLQLTPPGFKINGLTPTKDGYIIEGVYEDGRRGVLTQQGGTGDGETVMTLSKKDINHFLNLANSQMMSDAGMADRNLQLNANINLAEAVTAQHGDLNETAVVGAVSSAETQAGSDRQASRALMSALSSAETEAERQGIILDFANENGIEIPYREEAEQIVAQAAPQGSAATRAQGRGRMGRAASMREANKDTRRQELPGELAAARKDLAEMEALMKERGVRDDHPTLQQRRDKIFYLEKEMEELGVAPQQQEQVSTEPVVDFEALQASVDQYVANIPPEEVSATAQSLEQQGVKSVADIPKLESVEEQARAWAFVATYAQDPTTRNNAVQAIANLGETGIASLSAKDAGTLQVNQTNAAAAAQNAATAWFNANKEEYLGIDPTNDLLDRIDTAITEDEAPLSDKSYDLFARALTQTKPNSPARKSVRNKFNKQANQAIVDAANNPDSIWGSFLSLFDTNATVDPTAFKFENVRVRFNDKNEPVEFYLINTDGKPGGQPIPAGDMYDALGGSSDAFSAVVAAAKENAALDAQK